MAEPYNNFQNRFITLDGLELPELPEALEFGGDSFVRKSEFHITLLAAENAAALVDESKAEELKPEIVNEFYKFVGSQPLTDYELTGELRLAELSDDNKTVIVMAALKGIEKFFDTLSQKYKVEIPVQPTHITLYTLPSDRFGIPINSYDELERVSEAVDLPDIRKRLSQDEGPATTTA